MNKYKVCVYAISKNEEKFVERWVNSMKEADEIYVLDTGSKDKTIKKLKRMGVHVKKKIIKPWRFDVARNLSLEMVPNDTDICVCTDLDEVFKSGWRNELEQLWDNTITRMRYNYNWRLDNNKPVVNFYIEKIHTRNDYKWVNPVHEVLKYIGNNVEVTKTTDLITLNHYPDNFKSRSSYLPLLELSVKEDPNNDRNMHYLGREYMYYGMWNKSIDTLIKHLSLKNSVWKDERCASMRFISRCYKALKRYDEAKLWLDKAITEAPYLRDPYVEYAILSYELKEWDNVYKYCSQALKITKHTKTYINEIFSFDHTIYDLLSLYYYQIKDFKQSLNYVIKALEISPGNERLIKNKEIIKKEIS